MGKISEYRNSLSTVVFLSSKGVKQQFLIGPVFWLDVFKNCYKLNNSERDVTKEF